MATHNDKGKVRIVKETFPSEIISIIGGILAGILLLLLILPFNSFIVLILIIPALLSLRGNISGPFIARTSRDLIVGEFNKQSLFENILATLSLSIVTAILIGLLSIILNLFLLHALTLPIYILILIPVISVLLTLTISIPCSTGLNYFAFKHGIDPNNFVHPIMTAIDDFSTVICFYLTLILLGVP
jgi:mgtE-like transporter